MGRRLSHPQLMQDEDKCLMYNAKNSTGAAQAHARAGRLARQADGAVFATWAKPRCWRRSSPPKSRSLARTFFPRRFTTRRRRSPPDEFPAATSSAKGVLSDRETLTSRLIDRPIRPLFPEDFRCDTQVIATVFSYDLETDLDILAMITSSAALTLSGVPFVGPIGAARVGFIKGEIRVNATVEEMKIPRSISSSPARRTRC